MYWEFELKSLQNTLLTKGDWQNHEVKLVNNHLIIFKEYLLILIVLVSVAMWLSLVAQGGDSSLRFVGFSLSWVPLLASLVAQMVENLPVMGETWIWSLGQEDPLEETMATHSIILAWRIPWTAEPGRLESIGLQGAGHDWATNTFIFTPIVAHGFSWFAACGILLDQGSNHFPML